MTLSQKQGRFTVLVAKLILFTEGRGEVLTFGEAYRSPEEAARLLRAGKGIAKSLHTSRLAIDLNLFIGGVYQTDSAAYEPLGVWWEAQSTAELSCHWGGRFIGANGLPETDGNHFSCGHGGIQ